MISVCMATYNGEKYIKQQIASILSQLSYSDELIISDDGSTDGTLQIINSLNDPRITVLHHSQKKTLLKRQYRNGYLCSQNFQNALNASVGDIIFLSDQDDVWIDGKVDAFVKALQTHSLVMSNFSIMDINEKIQKQHNFKSCPFKSSVLYNISVNPFFGCAMAFRKEVLGYALPIPLECVSYDLWIGSLVAKKKAVFFVPESWHIYRRHNSNISKATGKSSNSLCFKIWWRIKFVFLFLSRYISKRRFM